VDIVHASIPDYYAANESFARKRKHERILLHVPTSEFFSWSRGYFVTIRWLFPRAEEFAVAQLATILIWYL